MRGLTGAPGTDHLLWLTTGSAGCRSYPVAMTSVYLVPRRGQPDGRTIWPEHGWPRPCRARFGRHRAAWPGLPLVHGPVHFGLPPGGSYVPPGVAGSAYVSPGYGRPRS